MWLTVNLAFSALSIPRKEAKLQFSRQNEMTDYISRTSMEGTTESYSCIGRKEGLLRVQHMKKSFMFPGKGGNLVWERRWSKRRDDGSSQRQQGQSGESLSGNARNTNKDQSFWVRREQGWRIKKRSGAGCEIQNMLIRNIMREHIMNRDRKLESVSCLLQEVVILKIKPQNFR